MCTHLDIHISHWLVILFLWCIIYSLVVLVQRHVLRCKITTEEDDTLPPDVSFLRHRRWTGEVDGTELTMEMSPTFVRLRREERVGDTVAVGVGWRDG
jgi:hypothetical protein